MDEADGAACACPPAGEGVCMVMAPANGVYVWLVVMCFSSSVV